PSHRTLPVARCASRSRTPASTPRRFRLGCRERDFPGSLSMRHTSPVLITSLFLLVQAGCVTAGGGADWPMFRRDFAGTGYSPLTQIDTANVSDLGLAWIYSLEGVIPAEPGGAPRPPNSQATPIVVDSVMYLPAADRVVAIDPTTGGEIWRYTLTEGAPSRRGVAYWPGSFGQAPRILFTAGTR